MLLPERKGVSLDSRSLKVTQTTEAVQLKHSFFESPDFLGLLSSGTHLCLILIFIALPGTEYPVFSLITLQTSNSNGYELLLLAKTLKLVTTLCPHTVGFSD